MNKKQTKRSQEQRRDDFIQAVDQAIIPNVTVDEVARVLVHLGMDETTQIVIGPVMTVTTPDGAKMLRLWFDERIDNFISVWKIPSPWTDIRKEDRR